MDVKNQQPRFTRYLRSLGELEPDRSAFIPVLFDANPDKNKRGFQSNAVQFLWADLCNEVEKNLGPKNEVLKHLKVLKNIAKDIAGEEQSAGVVNEAALYLFNLFAGFTKIHQKHKILLKKMFGSVSSVAVDKAFNVIKIIEKKMPEEILIKLQGTQENYKNEERKKSKWELEEYNQLYEFLPDINHLDDLTCFIDCFNSFSMAYSNNVNQNEKKPTQKKFVYGKSWMLKEVKRCFMDSFTGLKVEELCDTLIQLLSSSKSNDELQNELFELLGFDRFELIQLLLEHRSDIILSSAIQEDKKYNPGIPSESKRREAVLAQVVVKSQEEKILEKLARKEEKKLSKFVSRDESYDEKEEFDPAELRAKRLAALSLGPSVSTTEKRTTFKEAYPHVHDSMAKVKQQTGYICGMKMMLPEDVERKDTKQYEEVTIPVSQPAPVSVGKDLVPITKLDEVGKAVFSGIKTLNRIQSVVYETAYGTNENLLICAPTGAGKTNIALLTMVHTIRQHITENIIKKDTFKIVYVAPMKALAAEMTANFKSKLSPLGIIARELTGDMQLTKTEILQTQVLVTTPEKWDVVTRKGTGDVALTKLVKLLIIDEVHLLHGDRGPVVEALVARTLRQVESSQSMIRIVGLSATLPNYLDVARFLHVNPFKGLFYFDSRFRPVPLKQTFIGVKAVKPLQQMSDMDSVCYEKVFEMVQKGHQVMVFVHARNATVRTANILVEMAQQKGHLQYFEAENCPALGSATQAMTKARSKQLGELFRYGFSIHHAGLLRSDRSLVEKIFGQGLIKVLVCTSTLAWGVNLPAHAVVIRGTEIYDSKHGTFVDLGILDVLQIFGRAGRPQFDSSGHGTIITSHSKLSHYLSLLSIGN